MFISAGDAFGPAKNCINILKKIKKILLKMKFLKNKGIRYFFLQPRLEYDNIPSHLGKFIELKGRKNSEAC